MFSKWLRIQPVQDNANQLGFRWSEITSLTPRTTLRNTSQVQHTATIRKQVISYIKRWLCNAALVRGWECRRPSLGCCEMLYSCFFSPCSSPCCKRSHIARSSLSDFVFTASFSNPRSCLQLLVRRSHLLRCPVIQDDVNALVDSLHVLLVP